VSRRAHQVLHELASSDGGSISDLIERLATQERRRRILAESATRMAEIMANPTERKSYLAELAHSEAIADEVVDVA
jgi:hypothetical protein